MQQADVVIVGAGMAGASAAYFLAPQRRVVVLEMEAQPGYHATGRSAALFSETYGNSTVRALSTGSKAFYTQPPQGFAAHPLLAPRGALIVGGPGDVASLQATCAEWQVLVPSVRLMTAAELRERVPVLRPEFAHLGVWEPDAADMDAHAIHQGFLRGARAHGATLVCKAPATALCRAGGQWQLDTPQGCWQAPVVVNAAGAWADELAVLAGVQPVGLVPKRRSAFITEPPPAVDVRAWPLVIDAHESFYFKPDAGQLLVSPANEDPVPAQDVQPEELDVALAVERLQAATTLNVRRVLRSWAGLRSFVADKTPVVGYAPDAPGFFWLAGQGGYGIQTAPAMGEVAAALLLAQPVPGAMVALGVRAADLAAGRAGLTAPCE
jgi:D-arginine dehydrogenase